MEPAFETLEGGGGSGLGPKDGDQPPRIGPLEAEALPPGFVDESFDRRALPAIHGAGTGLGDER